MNYTIQNLEAFCVVGQEIELTNSQSRNIQISIQFWKRFNAELKRCFLSQSGNWTKYAFMERRNGKLFYYCAVPGKTAVPEGFTVKEIPPHRYLVAEHIGAMDHIYETYTEIYQALLPENNYELMQGDFLHFEKYDFRFHWNRPDSVIGIWIPVQEKAVPRRGENGNT